MAKKSKKKSATKKTVAKRSTTARRTTTRKKPAKKTSAALPRARSPRPVTAKQAEAATAFPPTLTFMIGFCSGAEGRTVGEEEVLSTLTNVRPIPLNATINETYHIPAGVNRYPGSRPPFAMDLRGAALDIKNDLHHKGVNVPLE